MVMSLWPTFLAHPVITSFHQRHTPSRLAFDRYMIKTVVLRVWVYVVITFRCRQAYTMNGIIICLQCIALPAGDIGFCVIRWRYETQMADTICGRPSCLRPFSFTFQEASVGAGQPDWQDRFVGSFVTIIMPQQFCVSTASSATRSSSWLSPSKWLPLPSSCSFFCRPACVFPVCKQHPRKCVERTKIQ